MTRRKLPLLLCIVIVAVAFAVVAIAQAATNAPAAFATPVNNDQSGAVSNGFTTNAVFAADEGVFMEEEDIGDGLGPVYNARSCVDCHAQPNVGGTSQVSELRVGHTDAAGNFVNPTLTINDGATTFPTARWSMTVPSAPRAALTCPERRPCAHCAPLPTCWAMALWKPLTATRW
jgi:hypothetical protein